MFNPEAHRALFLGLGPGITLGGASQFQGIQFDAVELVPEIVDLLGEFATANHDVAHRPNIRLHIADARRFVGRTKDKYDVIVADVFHPSQDGAGPFRHSQPAEHAGMAGTPADPRRRNRASPDRLPGRQSR